MGVSGTGALVQALVCSNVAASAATEHREQLG